MAISEAVAISGELAANLRGDRKGLPDWYTHFGDEDFARSAIPVFAGSIASAYPGAPLTVVGLGAGVGFYERVVGRYLKGEGYQPSVFVTDLQLGSLQHVHREDFPVLPILSDATALPLRSPVGAEGQEQPPRLLLSRAIEHYLPEGVLPSLVREAARVLRPGELYVAQITSAQSVAREVFPRVLEAIAGKAVHYAPPEAYKARVNDIRGAAGNLFREVAYGAATSQPRTSLPNARRYLNSEFLNLYGIADPVTRKQVEHITEVRARLGKAVFFGQLDRDKAIKQLDYTIRDTDAFKLFRQVYVESADDILNNREADENSGVRRIIVDGEEDIEIDVDYPVIVWERTTA